MLLIQPNKSIPDLLVCLSSSLQKIQHLNFYTSKNVYLNLNLSFHHEFVILVMFSVNIIK